MKIEKIVSFWSIQHGLTTQTYNDLSTFLSEIIKSHVEPRF